MKRRPDGRERLTTRVYKYGLPALSEATWPEKGDTIEKALHQLRLGHAYRNKLVEIERTRRQAYHNALADCDADVSLAWKEVRELEEQLERVRDAIQSERSGIRRRNQCPEGKDEADRIRTELARALEHLRDREKAARKTDSAKERLREVDEIARKTSKDAYGDYGTQGLYWGTRCAWMRVAKDQFRKGPPPRYKRFDASGFLSVQLQSQGERNGYSIADIVGDGEDASAARRLVQLDLDSTRRRQGRRYGTLRLRVGSTGRDPVFASWPLVWHRDIPREARVKWVRVVARRVAGHLRWHLCFEVEMPATWHAEPCGRGRVAVDLGWRRTAVDDAVTVEVARWQGDDGASGTVVVPPGVVGQLAKAAELRSLRDDHFHAARDALAAMLRHAKLSEEHRDRVAHLARWRSPRRLVGLSRWWSQNPLGDDDAIAAYLASYVRRDYHLWEWEANARRKAIERRQHVFRNAAARLARRYGTAVMDDLDLRQMAKRPAPESDRYEERADVSQSQRTVAAPGELREAIVWAFRARGGSVERAKAGQSLETMLSASGGVCQDEAATARTSKKTGLEGG